ncbi:MAG: 4Fe-4S dicluster domain-containing protein [Zoogloeaceae bacterium]|jgi:molybdopterin-containing oxidoreductase family iron-sulfur binding subunit|nr:4Fe-4S dicluster domain-containing protein [Zoogloeaceae bacterium]
MNERGDIGNNDNRGNNARDGNNGRRGFIAAAATLTTLATLTLAPGIRLIQIAAARPEEEAASAAVRWGLLIDVTRCQTGCEDCVAACGKENGLGEVARPRTDAQWIRKIDLKEHATGRALSLPMMCQHCAHPPCVDVCPTGASFKRADGIVLVDRHICIGCRYCMMACPYKARSFVHEPHTDQNPEVPRGQGCVEGCTLCVHRIDRGETPACVAACAAAGHAAMLFGDLNDPASAISQRIREVRTTVARADLALDPGVRYEGL